MIRPFICTCDKRLKTLKRFVNSYNANAKKHLLPPVIYYDGDGEYYHRLLDSMGPLIKIKQRVFNDKEYGAYSETIDYKAIWEFPRLSKLHTPDEVMLFLEDDLLFSSKFGKAIEEVGRQFKDYHTVDIVTLYGSGDCYWPSENNKARNAIYKFSGQDYYGNLAVAFSPKVLDWWLNHRHDLWNNNYSGWDIKIGNVFEAVGFNFYCTQRHYVQHQVGPSVIAESYKNQQSNNFVG